MVVSCITYRGVICSDTKSVVVIRVTCTRVAVGASVPLVWPKSPLVGAAVDSVTAKAYRISMILNIIFSRNTTRYFVRKGCRRLPVNLDWLLRVISPPCSTILGILLLSLLASICTNLQDNVLIFQCSCKKWLTVSLKSTWWFGHTRQVLYLLPLQSVLLCWPLVLGLLIWYKTPLTGLPTHLFTTITNTTGHTNSEVVAPHSVSACSSRPVDLALLPLLISHIWPHLFPRPRHCPLDA